MTCERAKESVSQSVSQSAGLAGSQPCVVARQGVAYLGQERCEIPGQPALVLLGAFLRLEDVLVHLIVGEEGVLGLEDFHCG